jgi:hypothetical protein
MSAPSTPGPWSIGPHQRIISSGWSIRIKDGSAIAYVLGEKNPELQANARLIAAAPELLDALRKAIDALAGGLWDYGPGQDEHDQCNQVVDECRAAIAKATGTTQ